MLYQRVMGQIGTKFLDQEIDTKIIVHCSATKPTHFVDAANRQKWK